jgi:hypothetical protein
MRTCIVVLAALLIAGSVAAQVNTNQPTQDTGEQPISHGEFAILLLQVFATQPDGEWTGDTALAETKKLNLVPQTWQVDALLTHGEFADILERLGGHYTPTDRDAIASRPFVEAMLRREMLRLRDYPARRMGVGDSLSHILDEGVDRGVVSPSDF